MGTSTGSASYMYDEEVPQAYEQVSDGKNKLWLTKLVTLWITTHVMYTSPTLEMMGASITAHLGYSPQASDKAVGDGGQVTYSATYGAGKEAGINNCLRRFKTWCLRC